MLSYVIRKIKNKKWLNLCLLTGILLFAAVFTCHPMLEKGAGNKILQQLFAEYAEEQNSYPAVVSYASATESGFHSLQEVFDKMDTYEGEWKREMDIDTVCTQQYVSLPSQNANSSLGGRNWMLSAGCLRDMGEHIRMVKEMDPQKESTAFPCIVSESAMDVYGMAVGEELTYANVVNGKGEPVRFVIRGVFAMASETDPYWYKAPKDFDHTLFVSQDIFDTLLSDYDFRELTYENRLLFDHTQITWRNASRFRQCIYDWIEKDGAVSSEMLDILERYETESRNAVLILWVLELPCLVLLLLFIYMVSSQIFASEEGEIAVFRSRGISRGQVLRLYLLQSFVLTLAGILAGIPAGMFLCRIAAGTNAFLAFTGKDTSLYRANGWMFLYAAAAGLLVLLFMTLPVWRRSDTTIVEQKKKRASKEKKPFWERFFLDLILLGLSLYLLYNYEKQSVSWEAGLMDAGQMDPMIFLNASLFAFSCALVLIRLSKYVLRLIWRMGAKHWRPALYASFLEMIRTFSKRSFLAVFLVMTVANGIFDANMARTMNENGEERLRYDVGCDLRLMERWEKRYVLKVGGTQEGYYEEPDFDTYESFVQEGLCQKVTRVLIDDETEVSMAGKTLPDCRLMGIHTKEFGETARLMDGINEEHWYHALNKLAGIPEGAIISRNMAQELDLKVGDIMDYSRYRPFGDPNNREQRHANAEVCAIVDGFPGYDRYGQSEEGYLVVVNYGEMTNQFEQTPYEIWMRLADQAEPEQIQAALEKREILLDRWTSLSQKLEDRENAPLIQITNGLFTMNFLISLLICSVGFLIYWIMSIRNREQLFGIYRAMGMRLRELVAMLLNEQIFGSLLSILFGVVAGLLVTQLFTRLTALIYLPEKHVISIRIFLYRSDMIKLFSVLGVVILICLFILWRIVKGMKIAQALRMGEEE